MTSFANCIYFLLVIFVLLQSIQGKLLYYDIIYYKISQQTHILLSFFIGHSSYQKRLHQVASINNPTIQLLHPTTSQLSLKKRSSLQHFSDLQHDDTFILQFEAYDQPFILQLTPNSDLFHPVATETILHPDGQETKQLISPEHFRIYKGHIVPSYDFVDMDLSPNLDHWARITVRHDIQ